MFLTNYMELGIVTPCSLTVMLEEERERERELLCQMRLDSNKTSRIQEGGRLCRVQCRYVQFLFCADTWDLSDLLLIPGVVISFVGQLGAQKKAGWHQ